jgi:hypothetical protein
VSTHELKTWPDPFRAILDGRKRHEIRVDDRGYEEGDVLHLLEWERDKPDGQRYTGRALTVRVTYKTEGGHWGLPNGVCVMSIDVMHQETP